MGMGRNVDFQRVYISAAFSDTSVTHGYKCSRGHRESPRQYNFSIFEVFPASWNGWVGVLEVKVGALRNIYGVRWKWYWKFVYPPDNPKSPNLSY
jgi:hypothetical protein